MRVRIVVADQSEARFYDVEHRDSQLRLIATLTDPLAHLHDRDFKSDRPGRVYDHAAGKGRRGATAHHGTAGERSPRKHEAEMFARRIAAQVQTAYRQNEFDRLILIAAPGFLGLLRHALPASLTAIVAGEVGKNLVREAATAVAAHVPADTFHTVAQG
ncbi:MAG: host attachment protein [Proteobacteria bacterium]|nr:host attachment protein [Pseudomonadota bacterium]